MFETVKEFEGIIGTIIGVFLGYFIQKIGKLKMYIDKSEFEFYYEDNVGFTSQNKTDNSKFNYCVYVSNLYIYNSSLEYKNIRNFNIIINHGNNEIIKNAFTEKDKQKIYNILPKSTEYIELSYVFTDEEFNMIKDKEIKIQLEYKNSRNKVKRKKLFKGKISSYDHK